MNTVLLELEECPEIAATKLFGLAIKSRSFPNPINTLAIAKNKRERNKSLDRYDQVATILESTVKDVLSQTKTSKNARELVSIFNLGQNTLDEWAIQAGRKKKVTLGNPLLKCRQRRKRSCKLVDKDVDLKKSRFATEAMGLDGSAPSSIEQEHCSRVNGAT